MGLGLYVNDNRVAGWSYSGFHAFRERLARELDIDINKMEGFHDVPKSILEEQGWDAYMEAMKADEAKEKISWESISQPSIWDVVRLTDEPRSTPHFDRIKAIMPLLHHSDCEGEIAADLCGPMADVLEQLVQNWDESRTVDIPANLQLIGYKAQMTFKDYDKEQALSLAEGLREAAKTGMPLVFC